MFQLSLSDRISDLLSREADLAIRMTEPMQGALLARRLPSVDLGFQAGLLWTRRQSPDPVPSTDDIHIANFVALLRVLAKAHGRQVVIAVHDCQLLEYLRLELSPAYPEDSLLDFE